MYNNAASETILGYLSEEEMRFPAYTYEEEDGYVAQDIRGSYTRDDEKEVSQIKAGGLYLFSDGQLRLYFKDVPDAGITATPVSYKQKYLKAKKGNKNGKNKQDFCSTICNNSSYCWYGAGSR